MAAVSMVLGGGCADYSDVWRIGMSDEGFPPHSAIPRTEPEVEMWAWGTIEDHGYSIERRERGDDSPINWVNPVTDTVLLRRDWLEMTMGYRSFVLSHEMGHVLQGDIDGYLSDEHYRMGYELQAGRLSMRVAGALGPEMSRSVRFVVEEAVSAITSNASDYDEEVLADMAEALQREYYDSRMKVHGY